MSSTKNFKVIVERDRIAESQSLFAKTMTAASDRTEDIELGYQGGRVPATVHWRSDLDLWMTFREIEARYWDAFGIGNPFEGWKSIVVEINTPFEGIDRRIGGVFLEDQSGAVYVGHRGKIGGGRKGIGQEAFLATFHSDDMVEFVDGEQTSKAVLIGRLDSEDLPKQVASFVRDVQRFKVNAVKEQSFGTALHVLLKWNRAVESSTIERHKSIAEQHGSVWWGKFGTGTIAREKLNRLRGQIEKSIPTYVFLYRQGEAWRTQLLGVTLDAESVPDNRIPDYYSKNDCSAFFELSNFKELSPDWPSENLVLASQPKRPDRMIGALGNQTTPLFVYERAPATIKPGPPPPPIESPNLEWLADKTLWPRNALEELCVDICTTSPQVVLAGPPGTGKTWVAKHIAKYLTKGNESATRIVQFHPSYGYEEFIQGIRPVVDENLGAIQFKVVNGVVVRMVEDIDDEKQIYVLVIDEMNRANLPRVFGELMYLFEYREQAEAIDLQYSNGFSLPRNLKFIGTMNTADRSIRSIDVALRRRFEVIECAPDRNILERYYSNSLRQNHIESLYDGFEQLNERLTTELDKHHTIGHTFFMANEMTARRLRKIWDRQLGPLIDEYFFDQPDIAGEFSPGEFWPELESE